MGIPTFRVTLRALFAVAGLLGVAAAQAQNINIAGANSTNDRVYSLNFGPKGITTTVQNTDSGSFGSIQSLAFILNPTTSALDLLVADDTGGKISVYPGDFTNGPPQAPKTSTVVWTASQGGPAAPNGLSVDLAGDLFVVNTSAGKPQLWVFPAAGTGGCAPLASYSALCAPVLVDSAFSAGQVLVDTTLVPSVPNVMPGVGIANTGDLLLLTSNPAMVLDYPFPAVSNANRSTLLTLPAGTTPGGLAFWPLDNSLLIANQTADSILRYSCCSSPAPMTSFASNLGGSGKLMYKIKTGFQNGAPYAFAVQAGSVADILQFGEGATVSGPGKLLATIAQNINHPEGIAVTNAASAAANTCNTTGGCNPTGLLSQTVPGSTSPKLVEEVCVVPVDPRVTVNGNTWSCDGTALPVNTVCPGFDTTGKGMFIPGYMCGMSGDSAASTPRGFTLIKTLTNNGAFNGTIIENVTENVANEPACRPGGTLLWAPVAGEGTFVADGNTNETLELTDGCGTIHGGSSGGSLWGEGLALNTAFFAVSPSTALAMLADDKYVDLETTIQSELAANINSNVAGQLASASSTGCVPLSKSYLDFAQFETGSQQGQDLTIAADLLSNAGANTCDTIVTTNTPNGFTQSPNGIPPFNPSGQVRSRLANLYFTINSRILGNPPNASAPSWPPSPQLTAPPSGFSTLPPLPDLQAACVPSGLYPPPGGCPLLSPQASVVAGYAEPVSFTLYGSNNGISGCSLTSTDGTFNNAQAKATAPTYPFAGTATGTVPAGTAAGSYTYTMMCAYPDSANPVSSTVKASVKVLLPPTVSAPTMVVSGSPVTVSWVQNGSTGCTLTGSDGENVANADSTNSVTYTPNVTAPTTITYTLACATPSNASASASVSITGTPTLSLNPTGTVGGGSTTVSWVLNGATGCALSDNGNGTPTQFSAAVSGSGTYTSVEADAGTGGITFTLACSNIAPVTAFLTVGE